MATLQATTTIVSTKPVSGTPLTAKYNNPMSSKRSLTPAKWLSSSSGTKHLGVTRTLGGKKAKGSLPTAGKPKGAWVHRIRTKQNSLKQNYT